jgi:hypothetical protein
MSKEEQQKQESIDYQSLPPAVEVRWAAYGKLTLYPVDESELELLAQGSPDSLYLNFAIFLLSIAISFLTTLLTVVVSDRFFTVFVVITVLGFIAGLFLLILWFRKRRSVSDVIDKIKKRLPPEGIQEK